MLSWLLTEFMTIFETSLVLLFALLALSIVWTTLRVGISPVPSRRLARLAMLDAVGSPVAGSTIVDTGSGWGSVVIAAARRFPQAQVVGYELSLVPFLISVILKHLLNLTNLRIVHRDFMTQDLTRAAIILCYLYPTGMQRLSTKLVADQFSGLLISNTFTLTNMNAQRVVRIDDLFRSPVYIYHLSQGATDKDMINV